MPWINIKGQEVHVATGGKPLTDRDIEFITSVVEALNKEKAREEVSKPQDSPSREDHPDHRN